MNAHHCQFAPSPKLRQDEVSGQLQVSNQLTAYPLTAAITGFLICVNRVQLCRKSALYTSATGAPVKLEALNVINCIYIRTFFIFHLFDIRTRWRHNPSTYIQGHAERPTSEGSLRACQHDRTNILVILSLIECPVNLDHERRAECIEGLGPVQCDE